MQIVKMNQCMQLCSLVVFFAPLFVATCAKAGDSRDLLDIEAYRRPALLLQGIGQAKSSVTCRQDETQRYINQGVALLHGFDLREADLAFHHAVRLEPDCAMAWWGLAAANLSNTDLASRYIGQSVRDLSTFGLTVL